jgi:class 3 adenylate cyclase
VNTEKINEIYKNTEKHYLKAASNLRKSMIMLEHADSAISDVIPGFSADILEFGSYDRENYAVLFVDMRKSTDRAESVGAERTFLTMHVYLTALLEVVKYHKGKVIDIMGDGLMVFWGGRVAREEDSMSKSMAIKHAGLCGRDMLVIKNKVINPIIKKNNLGPEVSIGVGVTFDSVVVTKIGINGAYDVKVFGDCVNKASKYSNTVTNQIKVSKRVKEHWPSSPNGTIKFISADNGSAYILQQ